MTVASTTKKTSTRATKRRQYTGEGNPGLMGERCDGCGHTQGAHGGLDGCHALDAAGDACGCYPFSSDIKAPSPASDALRAMDAIDVQQDDEGFTIEEYAAYRKITPDTAKGRLNRFAHQGKLIMGWKRDSTGRRVRVYRPKES